MRLATANERALSRAVTWAIIGLSLTGCGGNFSDLPMPVAVATSTSTAEVGQVNIDIVSMDQWQDIKSRFDTKYGLTAQNAVKAVNQAASFENIAGIQSSSLGLGIEADGTIISNGATASNQSTTTNGVTTTTTSAGNTASGTQTTPTAAPAANPSTVGAVTAAQFPPTQTPTLAPMLGYQAGDALFRYAAVLDGGFGRIAPCGYLPVLVTFRVSIIPSKRAQPYDTYIDLSVLPGAPDTIAAPALKANAPAPAKAGSKSGGQALATAQPTDQGGSNVGNKVLQTLNSTRLFGTPASIAQVPAHDPQACGYLVPDDDLGILSFSSDSLENAESDVLAQQTKAIILAAAVRAGTVAASASYQHLSEELDHTLDLRPNSLLSVGRTGNNTLHIRLGANRYGANEFEMLPLEHDISIVLMVPYQFAYPASTVPDGSGDGTGANNVAAAVFQRPTQTGGSILAVGHYYFKDARSDTKVRSDPIQDADDAWRNKRESDLTNVAKAIKDQYAETLMLAGASDLRGVLDACARASESKGKSCDALSEDAYFIPNKTLRDFEVKIMPAEFLKAAPPDEESSSLGALALDLWQDLSEYSSRPGMTPRVTRRIPQSFRHCPTLDDIVLAKDDGANTIASITGADGYAGEHITADLTLWKKTTPNDKKTLSAGFDVSNGDIGDLQFGSFSNFFSKTDNVVGYLQFTMRDNLYCPGTTVPNSENNQAYEVSYKQAAAAATPPKAKVTPGVSAYPSQVGETDNKATFGFTLSLSDVKADSVDVTIAGTGQWVSISSTGTTPTPTLPKAGVITLTSSGDYSTQVQNISSGKTATLSFQFKSGGKPIKNGKSTISIPVIKG